jgi:hypothetical protein
MIDFLDVTAQMEGRILATKFSAKVPFRSATFQYASGAFAE